MYELYGIKNCSTVKKAIDWMDQKDIPFEFMDVKKNLLTKEILVIWVENMPDDFTWENLVNKSGVTWRKLNAVDKENASTQQGAYKLILNKPSVMKRPIISKNNQIISIGFNEMMFEEKFL